MSGGKTWFRRWSPYWEIYENQHLETTVMDRLMDHVAGPVLVVGSGQGLIVRHLEHKGVTVRSIDIEKEMIRMGMKRRGVRSILADGAALPLRGGCFRTVVIATGVLDYMTDMEVIRRIVLEAFRATSPFGNIIMTFYQFRPSAETVYRRLGILDGSGTLRLRRIFELSLDIMPGRCIPMVSGWTGKPWLVSTLLWTWTGMTLPRYLRANLRGFRKVIKLASADGVGPKDLIEALPESLPYRKENEIYDLLGRLGMGGSQLDFHEECITARYRKSPLLDIRRQSLPGPEASGTGGGRPVIVTRDLGKRYARARGPAVDGLSLSITEGTIFGILGPNGAGKTTTMMLLVGLIRPGAGSIRFYRDGAEIRGDDLRRITGYVPQELAIFPKLTARENLAYFAGLYGVHGKESRSRIDELLRMVGLTERAGELAVTFSTGMKRRLNLAAGLVHRPRILLLDEPTVGIDPQSRNCIFDSVLEMKGRGVTVLYTTHYMEEAGRLCDTVAIMDRGRVLLQGPPGELVSDYGLGRLIFKTGGRLPEPFIRSLKGIETVVDVEPGDGKLTMSLAGYHKSNLAVIDRIMSIAREQQLELSLQAIEEPTLESLFLDTTGRSLRDEEGAGIVENVFGRIG